MPQAIAAQSVPNLDLKISLRAPYVATLNILQCQCLKALREYQDKGLETDYNPSDPEIVELLSRDPAGTNNPYVSAIYDTLIITIKGVAAGMQNTG